MSDTETNHADGFFAEQISLSDQPTTHDRDDDSAPSESSSSSAYSSSASSEVESPSISSVRASSKTRSDKADQPRSRPTVSQPLQLTFGIEFECILLFREEWCHEIRNSLFKDVAPKERESDIEIQEVLQHHLVSVMRGAGLSVNQEQDSERSSSWIVDGDTSLHPDQEDEAKLAQGWNCRPLEIKTPILKYTQGALYQVEKALNVLNDAFRDESNFRFYVNPTCGLHVHIGSQNREEGKMVNAGFPFFVARNLYTACLFFEKRIHSVFPPEQKRLDSDYCLPLSKSFRNSGDIYGAAGTIEKTSTYSELVDALLPRARGVALNVMQLLEETYWSDSCYKTIEFRQHHGSLDPEDVCNWVKFVCGLVRLSHQAGEEGFPTVFLSRHSGDTFDFPDLLSCLNMGDLKAHYCTPGKLFQHPELHPWESVPGVYTPSGPTGNPDVDQLSGYSSEADGSSQAEGSSQADSFQIEDTDPQKGSSD